MLPPEKGFQTAQVKVGSKKQSGRQRSINEYVLKQKRSAVNKEKLKEHLTPDVAQRVLEGKPFELDGKMEVWQGSE